MPIPTRFPLFLLTATVLACGGNDSQSAETQVDAGSDASVEPDSSPPDGSVNGEQDATQDVAGDQSAEVSQDPGQPDSNADAEASVDDSGSVADADETVEDDRIQVMFTINTHDWVFLDDSAETLNRVIDIHEEYDVPVDIYLTDPMVQGYRADHPELLTRMRDHQLVTVSYHVRPPVPFYPNFDHAGITSMSDQDAYDMIMDYETHALDLEWGIPDPDVDGGYTLLEDLMGYAPPAVGTNSGGPLNETIYRLYADLGATFQVVHGRHVELGERNRGVLLRPEHVEIKLYEYRRGEDAVEVIEDHIADECDAPDRCVDATYVNIKFHENNFYAQDTTWWPVFFTDNSKSTPLSAPFDLNASDGVIRFKSPSVQNNLWTIYEDAVRYVAENPDRFRGIDVSDLIEQVEGL